jgi:uncharacterized membrane protein
MKRALLLAWLALAGIMAPGCFTPAQAALTLCNRTSYILYAATSAVQSPRSETTGWTRIAPGDCRLTRKEPLTAETYLVHARSSIAHSGPARAWGGNVAVCVKDGNFTIRRGTAQPACAADSFALDFAPVDNRGKSVWTMHFDEQPTMNMTEAQLAGVKRLLKDNGYKIARVDGRPDKTTGAALADFRKRMRFTDKDGNTELFDALEREARKAVAPAGYTVCNEAKDALMVALAQNDGGKAVSRGWWTIDPGACAKAITTPLSSEAVFVLAQRKTGGSLVAGPQRFCVTQAAFEISGADNCSTRGLAEAGFARTQTKGMSGYVARIGSLGLVSK